MFLENKKMFLDNKKCHYLDNSMKQKEICGKSTTKGPAVSDLGESLPPSSIVRHWKYITFSVTGTILRLSNNIITGLNVVHIHINTFPIEWWFLLYLPSLVLFRNHYPRWPRYGWPTSRSWSAYESRNRAVVLVAVSIGRTVTLHSHVLLIVFYMWQNKSLSMAKTCVSWIVSCFYGRTGATCYACISSHACTTKQYRSYFLEAQHQNLTELRGKFT